MSEPARRVHTSTQLLTVDAICADVIQFLTDRRQGSVLKLSQHSMRRSGMFFSELNHRNRSINMLRHTQSGGEDRAKIVLGWLPHCQVGCGEESTEG